MNQIMAAAKVNRATVNDQAAKTCPFLSIIHTNRLTSFTAGVMDGTDFMSGRRFIFGLCGHARTWLRPLANFPGDFGASESSLWPLVALQKPARDSLL